MRNSDNGTGTGRLAACMLALLLAIPGMASAGGTDDASAAGGGRMSDNALPDFISLWDFSDPAATEVKFREILPTAEAAGDELYLLELLTQIARSQGLQKKFDVAHTTLDRVEAMLSAGDAAGLEKGRLRYLLERGRAYNSAGEAQTAQPLFLEAYELGLTTQFDSLTIDAAHMLGIVTKDQESLDWNLKALELARQSTDEKAAQWQGSLYNNIGWTYMERKQPDMALELFLQGVEFRDANYHPENARMIAHWTVARALRELGRYEDALAKLQEIGGNFAGAAEDAFWHEELGENYLAQGREEEGLAELRIALPLLLELGWVEQWEPERVARLKQLTGWVEPEAETDGSDAGSGT
jgi:tetratricopeptide (TPR) repeat protein